MLDASTALAWCFPDESSDRADAVLVALEGEAVVPAVRRLEIANAVLAGERQKRLRQPDVLRFLTLLESLRHTGHTRCQAGWRKRRGAQA